MRSIAAAPLGTPSPSSAPQSSYAANSVADRPAAPRADVDPCPHGYRPATIHLCSVCSPTITAHEHNLQILDQLGQ